MNHAAATEDKPQQVTPSPLNRNEVGAMVGAGMIVLGTLMPAFHSGFGSTETLAESGNTAAVILWGMAFVIAWKVVRRQVHTATRVGVLCLLFLTAYGIFLWLDVREPVSTLFGTVQSSFRPTAWVVIAAGVCLAVLFAKLDARNRSASSDVPDPQGQIQAIGATLAVLACLFCVAIINPLGPLAPASFRRSFHAWEEELHVLRWILLCIAAAAIVACFQYPRKSPYILKPLIQILGLLMGVCLIWMTGIVAPEIWPWNAIVAVAWSVASVTCFAASRSKPLVRWQQFIVYSPFISAFALLLVSGEIPDAMLVLFPALTITAGYVICRDEKYVDAAIFSAALLLGLPAGLMALTDVPNEFAETCGISHAEIRTILLGVCTLSLWALCLSTFQTKNASTTKLATDATDAVSKSSNGESTE
jgi:hypothetical protein